VRLARQWGVRGARAGRAGAAPAGGSLHAARGGYAVAVDGGVAALLRRLRGRQGAGDAATRDDVLADLVLDGVVEIESDGRFVTGAAALDALGIRAPAPAARDVLGRRALEALRHAASLDVPVLGLARAMYRYGARPYTPERRATFETPEATASFLGLLGGAARAALDARWAPTGGRGPRGPWAGWQRRPVPEGAPPPSYKLYVSPALEHTRDALGELLAVAERARVAAFKVGHAAQTLLRPDRVVAYFPSLDALGHAAELLGERLAGLPADGVPFTAAAADTGLLSWGVDPPEGSAAYRHGARSWRQWVTRRLAAALAVARATAPDDGAGQVPYALLRISRLGVDPVTWAPTRPLAGPGAP
jgi:hypothetical protein